MVNAAKRVLNLPAYPFAILGQLIQEMIKQGQDVIRLDIGSPDMPPPDFVIDVLAASSRNPDHHGYSGYRGIPEFRRAVAKYYAKRFGVELSSETEVLPVIGSKEAIINLTFAYIDDGDVALVPTIGYPSYAMGACMAGGAVGYVPNMSDGGYMPNLGAIPETLLSKARLFWINYPNNPTGAVADLDFYAEMVAFCKRYDILLVSDNPYVDVTFDGYRAGSVLQVEGAKDHTVELISLSKSHNMAGWRLGAAVGNAKALKNLLNIKSNIDSGHFHPIYEAGAAALEQTSQTWIDERNAIYQRRRDEVLAALPEIGLTAHKPKGSLYIWAKVLDGNGQDYAQAALEKAQVSLAPGTIYGPDGSNYVRFSLGMSDERLTEALDRLKMWYGNNSH